MPDLSKSPERIAGMFDAIARRYDFLNHFLSGGIDRRWRRRAIGSLGLTGRERVLDVCSGTGDLALAARRATPSGARVVGVDFAHAMLQVGRRKIEEQQLSSSVSLVRGDALHLPVATSSVDAVTVAFGIRNVQDVGAALGEMHRVLKPGGRIAVLEFATPRQPLVRAGYAWYSRHVLPRIGRMLSRHDDAYGYLPASIEAFASPDAFVKLLRQNGFPAVTAVPLTFGIVYLYAGTRD